jgi:hypothetical protein
MGRLALTASNYGEATSFDPAPKKFSLSEMGLDASRDEGAHPSGSHRTGQTLTRIIQSNFAGSPASQSSGWILNASRSVLPIHYIRFPVERAWFEKKR